MIGAKVHNCAYAHLCPLWSYSFVMENPFRRILFYSTWLEAKYNIIFSPAVFISIPPPSPSLPPPLSLSHSFLFHAHSCAEVVITRALGILG